MTTLHWSGLGASGACHIGRIRYVPGQHFALHDHDYVELCWVEQGRLRHQSESGYEDLEAGDILFLRPEHRHGLSGLPGGGVLLNLAFPAADLDQLTVRYGDAQWPWQPASQPCRRRLPPTLLARASARSIALPPTTASRLERDALVLSVIAGLERSAERRWQGLPPWLAEALDAIADDDAALAAGVQALVARCARTREHVARTLRHALGRSPTDLVTDLRCERAARRLAHDEASAQAIAEDLGFTNRTWFHRVFRERFACTPGEYRRQARAAVG